MHNKEFGFEYIPGNGGKDCPGDGLHRDKRGKIIECCCDECDFLICCIEGFKCDNCGEYECEYNVSKDKKD